MLFTRRIAGARPELVFLHEALGSVAQWRDFPGKVCAATGLAGLLYDRQGHGQSPPLDSPRPLDFFDREAEVLANLAAPDSVLIGHSDGATIALAYAARYPLAAAVTIAPHVDVEPATVEGIRRAMPQFDDWRPRLERFHGPKAQALLDNWTRVWLDPQFIREFSLHDRLPRIACPLLAIQCTDDPYASRRQLEAIAARVPQARLHWIHGSSHLPHRDYEAETIASIVDFLKPAAGVP